MGYYYVIFTCKATVPGKTFEAGFRAVRAETRQDAVDQCLSKVGEYVSVRVEEDDYFANECMATYSNKTTYWTGD